MRIGILICDDVNPALEPEHGSYKDMFFKLLMAVDNTLELKYYWANHQQLPKHPAECDGYITSGSKSRVLDQETWIIELERFVQQVHLAKVPFVGICFGHQMLAKALGGEVSHAKVGWGVGVYVANILTKKTWMKPYQDKVSLLVSHQDQVISTPENTLVLASNDFCPISMMQVGETSLGIQAHPEFCAPYSKDLIEVRKESIPQAVQDAGLASLTMSTDGLLLAEWIVAFIKENAIKH